jgi:DNA adenine methylase
LGVVVTEAKPPFKWVGGKRQLLHVLLPLLTSQPFDRYHEPFVGGGAVFFALRNLGFNGRAWLSDINKDLLDAYCAISDATEELISVLLEHTKHNSESYFYKVRKWKDYPEVYFDTPLGRAARFVYLNRVCFNGLYRVNQSGEFNVPWGKYENPKICDEENLHACSVALKGAMIYCQDFSESLSRVASGDLCYLDPPYVPVSKTSNFTSYGKDGFSDKDQERLAAEFSRMDKLGARLVLSNADCSRVRELYASYNIHSTSARRNVNSVGSKRGKVGEVVVTNF